MRSSLTYRGMHLGRRIDGLTWNKRYHDVIDAFRATMMVTDRDQNIKNENVKKKKRQTGHK